MSLTKGSSASERPGVPGGSPDAGLSCDEARELAVDRAYGEADAQQIVQLDVHLSSCRACAEYGAAAVHLASVHLPVVVEPTVAQGHPALVWALTAPLAWAASAGVLAHPALGDCPAAVVWAQRLAWWALFAGLVEGLSVPRIRQVPGRTIVWGVLGGVGLCAAVVTAYCATEPAALAGWARHLLSRGPELLALASAGAALVVGLAMGVTHGEGAAVWMGIVGVLHGLTIRGLFRAGPWTAFDGLFAIELALLAALSGARLGGLVHRWSSEAHDSGLAA